MLRSEAAVGGAIRLSTVTVHDLLRSLSLTVPTKVTTMEFEWHEDKRRRNIELHGMDFMDAAVVFDGRSAFTYYSPRNNEDRWATVAMLRDRLWVVVWTVRGEQVRRIISAHRAGDAEGRQYRTLFG